MKWWSRRKAVSTEEVARIGVGIIGTKMSGGWMASACKALPGVEIVGLAEARTGAGESFAKQHEIDVPVFADFHDLLAMDGLDALIVTTPNNVHAPISIAAAEAGVHTLCQKPMATNIEDAEAMVAAAEKAGIVNMISYTKRFFGEARFLHDFLQREELGRIYHVRAAYLQNWLSDPEEPMRWRLRREVAGTGALGDLGSHITDLAQHLLEDEVARVTGMITTFVPERPSAAGSERKEAVEVDDAFMFGAEFKGGAMGVFQGTRNATGRLEHWRIEIDGEKGAVIYDSVDRSVRLCRSDRPGQGEWETLPIPAHYGKERSVIETELEHFVECIRTGEAPVPSFSDALQVERVLDAVQRSSTEGKAVDVE